MFIRTDHQCCTFEELNGFLVLLFRLRMLPLAHKAWGESGACLKKLLRASNSPPRSSPWPAVTGPIGYAVVGPGGIQTPPKHQGSCSGTGDCIQMLHGHDRDLTGDESRVKQLRLSGVIQRYLMVE